MAALEIPGNGDTGNRVNEECILKMVESLEDPLQKVRFPLPSSRPKLHELDSTVSLSFSTGNLDEMKFVQFCDAIIAN